MIGVADSFYGAPIEEGDVLTLPTALGAPPAIFIPGEVLGLATARSGAPGPFAPDDLNALDVVGPAPVPALDASGALALAAALIGLATIGLWARGIR